MIVFKHTMTEEEMESTLVISVLDAETGGIRISTVSLAQEIRESRAQTIIVLLPVVPRGIKLDSQDESHFAGMFLTPKPSWAYKSVLTELQYCFTKLHQAMVRFSVVSSTDYAMLQGSEWSDRSSLKGMTSMSI